MNQVPVIFRNEIVDGVTSSSRFSLFAFVAAQSREMKTGLTLALAPGGHARICFMSNEVACIFLKVVHLCCRCICAFTILNGIDRMELGTNT